MTENAAFSLPPSPRIGFIGLGAMGGGMAANLCAAGLTVEVLDVDPAKVEPLVDRGASPAGSVPALVEAVDLICLSLPSSKVAVDVIEQQVLPAARPGQVVIDFGTTQGPQVRRLAELLAEQQVHLLDAPVSGGSGRASEGRLHIFVGGERPVFDACRHILDNLGQPEHVNWCGPSGSGQAVKGVNQLGLGLVDAAFLEAIAYGVHGGVAPEAIARAIDGPEPWRQKLAHVARCAAEGRAEDIYIKFPELPYFLAEARDRGFPLPMTEALFNFCDPGPRNWVDNMGRPRVAYWYMLMQGSQSRP